MKRYLATISTIAFIYAVSCFAAWDFPIDLADWHWFGRLYFAIVNIFLVGLVWTWPGWSR